MKNRLLIACCCLVFSYSLFSCGTLYKTKNFQSQEKDSINKVYDVEVKLIYPYNARQFFNERTIAILPSLGLDISFVITENLDSSRFVILRYHFQNAEELQQVQDELLATGLVTVMIVTTK